MSKGVLLETGEEVELAHTVYIINGTQYQGTQELIDKVSELESLLEKRLLDEREREFLVNLITYSWERSLGPYAMKRLKKKLI